MNKNDFLTLINDPKLIAETDNQALSEILGIYPYFHTAHQLLLLNLKMTKSEKYDQQLRESAIHVPNRHVLFNLLYDFNKPIQQSANLQDINDNKPVTEKGVSSELLEIDENHINFTNAEPPKTVEFSKISDNSSELLHREPDFELEYETTTPENPKPEQPSQLSSFDLIEKFIEENPAFVPNRLELSETREDISLTSIIESEDLVSETLASVYTGQKLYDKAIATYEKLILKFPEKSTYFASRIEELRNNIK
jgi:hypothetical protein